MSCELEHVCLSFLLASLNKDLSSCMQCWKGIFDGTLSSKDLVCWVSCKGSLERITRALYG